LRKVRGIWPGCRLGHAALRGISLRQRQWNCADGHKQKQVKRASKKVRFGGGINLLFHFGVVLG
jgi:hypothetical protein